MSFREIEKEGLQAKVPPEIATEVREKAARDRQSLSAATTELLCRALGRNPRDFGIEPPAKRPKSKAAHAATA